MTTSGVVVVDQPERRPRRELPVGLVDDQQPVDRLGQRRAPRRTVASASTMPVGLLGEQRNATDGPASASTRAHLVEVEREVGGAARPRRPSVPRQPGDVAVQRVGRLPDRGARARAAVGEQQRSAAPRWSRWPRTPGRASTPCSRADGRPQLGGGRDRGSGASRSRRRPRRRRGARPAGGGLGRLVGVEPDLHVDLRRVVARPSSATSSRGAITVGPSARRRRRAVVDRRSRIDSAWASNPSASASASTCGATRSKPASVDGDDVDVLDEVVDGERAGRSGPSRRSAARGCGPAR